MALFKIFKGSSDKLYTSEKTKNLVEGYCYFTVDEGKFYIDIASEGDIYEKRICLNAAQADQLREKRTITLTGDAAGAFQFDGSEDVSVEITIAELDEINTAVSGKAPKSHASTGTTYGKGTSSKYGHVQLSDSVASDTAAASGGVAATPLAVKTAYDLANTANTQANTNLTNITQLQEDVKEISTKAPINHASSEATYGVGSSGNYGHLKLSSAINSSLNTDSGTAATPLAVKTAYDLANTANTTANTASTKATSNEGKITELTTSVNSLDSNKAPKSHASSATTYGAGTGSNYGHVKLSDSVASETAAASGGTAATPKAVKTAYDKAVNAASAASTNAGEITTLKGTVNDTLVPTVNNHSNKLQYTNITYGTCSTAAATAAKVIEIDTNAKWELKKGSFITVLFDATNTASNPTFNVGGTGAKNVYYTTSQITTKNLSYAGYAGRPMNFVYDGTQYRFAGWGVDANSDTKVTQSRDTSSSTYPVLLKYNTTTGDGTSTVKFNESINVTPSTGTLSATKFVGELDGKATTAGTADKVAHSLSINGDVVYDGSSDVSITTIRAVLIEIGSWDSENEYYNITSNLTGNECANLFSFSGVQIMAIGELAGMIGVLSFAGADKNGNLVFNVFNSPSSDENSLAFYQLVLYANEKKGALLVHTPFASHNSDTEAHKDMQQAFISEITNVSNTLSNRIDNITPASIGALAANGTAVKATADANGKNIASTYETKANVTTKVSEALNTAKDYTDTSISSLVNGAPEHLNTLKELADALGADANMSTTIVGMIGGKADKVHTHSDEDIIRSNWPSTHTITGNTLAEMLEDIEGHIDDTVGHIQNNTIHITSAERTQWNKAEVNQNAFSNIAVNGQTTVAADSKTDTVTFAGSNITITTDATNDKITFTVADGTTDAKGVVKLEDSVSSTSTSTAATPNSVRTAYVLANGKAPKAHAVNASTYGLGTSGVYGHVKLSDSTASTSAETAGIAATPKAVKTAYDLANSANTKAGTNATDIVQLKEDVKGIATKAPISHASSATTYGTGTSSNYGHVKLSDSTSSTSAASAGIAATPKAVNTAYNLANTAKGVADGAASKASSNETKIGEINTSINNLSSGKAPTNHASSETTYGTGSGDNYGHVKLSASVTDTSGITSGTAATPSAVKSAYDLANSANTKAGTNASNITQLKEDVKGIATKAPISHAVNANTYGLGTSSVYGHVKLSDSTSTASSVNAGVAATPTAVKTAYDLANTANATAGEAKTKATTNATAIEELNSSVNSHTHTVTGTVSKPSFTGSAATSRGPSNTTTVNSVTGVGTTPTLTSTVTNRCLKFTFSAGTTPSITSVTVPTSNHTHSVTATGSVSQPTFTSGTAASISSASV